MIKIIHHLLNPHCPDCRDEILESKICESCNTLRLENAQLRKHNDQLIQSLLNQLKPKEEVQVNQTTKLPRPVGGGLNWRARRQMLEQEDRQAAKILREKRIEMAVPVVSIEKLEEELGVESNG